METIKKKFLASTSKPIVVGDGLTFRILAHQGNFTSTLPFYIRSGEIITVDWGEGSIVKYSSGVISKQFNYLANDTYLDVVITSNMDDICASRQVDSRSYITELVSWGNKPLVNNLNFISGMFANESNLTKVAEDTNNVCSTLTDVRNMFSNCSELISVPKLDTSNCLYMGNMFRNNYKLEVVYSLDLSSVIDFSNTTRLFANPSNFGALKKLYINNLGKSSAELFRFEYCSDWDKESMLWTAEHSETLTTGTKYIYLDTTVGYDEAVTVWREKGYNVIGIMD